MAKTTIRFSFRIYEGNKPLLGPGRIELMQLIQKYGSIAKAAKAMSMSYRKAWQMVKDLNNLSGKPLIEVKLGGKKGGGAAITDEGVAKMKSYFSIQSKASACFEKALKEEGL